MKRTQITAILAFAGLAAFAAVYHFTSSPQEAPPGGALAAVTMPDSLSPDALIGQRAFAAKCATCHGANAQGKAGVAPPLIHKIYEPSHHGDAAFFAAARSGVRPHHWPFGPMPPVSGITDAEIGTIVVFVREVQRANGIR